MRQRIIFIAWQIGVMLGVGFYLFGAGSRYGVTQYKRSEAFYLTLDSMYRFGLLDCKSPQEHNHDGF